MGRKRTKSGKIRLTEVAKLAGVSPITASRFFRNPEALSVAKRTRVDSAAKELGYVPNLAARALASQRTEVIGVLIPSLTNNVFSDVLRGIYDALGRQPIQHPARQHPLQHPPGGETAAALSGAEAGRTDRHRHQPDRGFPRDPRDGDCPVVQIMEIGPDPVDMMIGFSHYDASTRGDSPSFAQGHRRIGFLGARMDPRVQRRLEGYRPR